MNTMPFVFAGKETNTAFADIVQPLFAKLRTNTDINKTLFALRDSLLSDLISDALRMIDAEKFLQEAI